MARPDKLTEETHNAIVAAVAAGNYMETAAAYAGISKDTLYKWLKRGRRCERGKYRQFTDAVEKAQGESEVRDLQAIGLDSSWQSKAWRLERRFPQNWGRRAVAEGDENNAESIAAAVTTALAALDAINEAEGAE